MKSGKSLVIFGCGYLGRVVAKRAIALGMRVIALTRNGAQAAQLRSEGVSLVVEASLEQEDWHERIEPRQDYVLNCVSSGGAGVEGYRQSYLAGQQSLLRWAGKGKIGTFIYTGTTGVYSQSGGELVDEDSPCENLSPLGEVLLQAERVLVEQANPSAIERWFILRLGGIYGPGRHYLLNQLRSGETVFSGSGDFYMNLIHRDDVVSGVFALWEASVEVRNRIYNLVDGDFPTKRLIVEWLADHLGVRKPRFDPARIFQREEQRRNALGAFPNRRIASDRIRCELNWHPVYPSFREGYVALTQASSFSE